MLNSLYLRVSLVQHSSKSSRQNKHGKAKYLTGDLKHFSIEVFSTQIYTSFTTTVLNVNAHKAGNNKIISVSAVYAMSVS
jgi:hypothetical protein